MQDWNHLRILEPLKVGYYLAILDTGVGENRLKVVP